MSKEATMSTMDRDKPRDLLMPYTAREKETNVKRDTYQRPYGGLPFDLENVKISLRTR